MESNNEALIKELAQRMSGAKFWMYLIGIVVGIIVFLFFSSVIMSTLASHHII